MRITSGLRQGAISAAVFCGVMFAVISVDARVRERLTELLAGGGLASFPERAGDVVEALLTAARYQTLENAPLVVFAAVGAVLFVFMVKA
jgi:hypothetical protein